MALKLAYDGTRFSGSQIQPKVRTVHAELAHALEALGHAGGDRLLWAGRTDAGVSAAGAVVAFETHVPPDTLLPALTHAMSDVWAWAWAEVAADFEPRHATSRHYRYHLRADLDAAPVADALRLFEGEHDFSSFSRVEPGLSPRRTVSRTSVARNGPFLVVDVEGPNFLWNQVRRMVEAARRVAAGEVRADEVRAALAGELRRDFGLAPPEPLVLMDVRYRDVAFKAVEGDMARRIFSRLDERLVLLQREVAVLMDLRRATEAPP